MKAHLYADLGTTSYTYLLRQTPVRQLAIARTYSLRCNGCILIGGGATPDSARSIWSRLASRLGGSILRHSALHTDEERPCHSSLEEAAEESEYIQRHMSQSMGEPKRMKKKAKNIDTQEGLGKFLSTYRQMLHRTAVQIMSSRAVRVRTLRSRRSSTATILRWLYSQVRTAEEGRKEDVPVSS